MPLLNESHDGLYSVDVKEYAPSIASESVRAHPSRLSCEEKARPLLTETELPVIDGGKNAWLFLTASAVLEALVWGKNHLRGQLYHI